MNDAPAAETLQTADDFSRLSPADRQAILRELAPLERLKLKYFIQRRQRQAQAQAAIKPDFSNCSPWLAKQLIAILNGRPSNSAVTAATRAALCVVAARRSGAALAPLD